MKRTNIIEKIIKQISGEFIYGGHLLSLGASCIVWSSAIIGGLPINRSLFLLPYIVSQIVYNFDHITDNSKEKGSTNSERNSYLSKTKAVQVGLLLLYVVVFAFLEINVKLSVSLLSLIIVLGGVCYTLFLKKITQMIVGFKNVYVAFFWGILVFYVPLDSGTPIFFNTFIFFSFLTFIRWLLNTTYFDIKDLKEDKKNGLKTFPAILGLKNTLFFLHIVNFASVLVIGLTVVMDTLPVYAAFLSIFTIYSYIYLLITLRITKEYQQKLSYIVVDGEYLLWPLALWFGKLVLL